MDTSNSCSPPTSSGETTSSVKSTKNAVQGEGSGGSNSSVLGRYLDVTTEELMNGHFNLTVHRHLGSGYAGSVYKCRVQHSSHGQSDAGSTGRERYEVALKVLLKDKTKAKAAAKEVNLLKAACGQHVLKYLTSMECIDAYWIITEYCSKGDLHGMLRFLDDCQIMAREYMRDVVAGLQSLHDKLIVHSDIKMKNILITNKNVAKIADFGFAKQYSSEDDREAVCHGTRDYWAPEMMNDCPNYNPFLADIYALGVTFVGVCEKRPIKLKYDNIHDIVNKFRDLHQLTLFRGVLSNHTHRWSLDRVKNSLWINECASPPISPV